jgi:hypothetical protein
LQRDRHSRHGLPLAPRHLQTEQDRASPVRVHHQELARQPLVSHQAIAQPIGATTTHPGLQVRAEVDSNIYPAGIKVTDAEMASPALERHAFHGEWNYTLHPRV